MTDQKQKFMATLAVLVGRLEDMGDLLPGAERLARQHFLYGVQDSHYPLVGQALLWTLERELGPDWTPAVAEAWRRIYEWVSSRMIEQSDTIRS
jgi:hemoglobin-like flavoprotein